MEEEAQLAPAPVPLLSNAQQDTKQPERSPSPRPSHSATGLAPQRTGFYLPNDDSLPLSQ